MKIKLALFALTFSVILCSGGAHAQDAANVAPGPPQPPAGPLVAAAPDFSQWIVTFSYPTDRVKGATPSETRTRTITTTKTGDIVHQEIVGAQGDKNDEWRVGRTNYGKPTGSDTWFQATKPTASSPTGFDDLDWIAGQNYIGTMKYSGHTCLVFAQDAPPHLNVSRPNFPVDQLDAINTVAFIDADSRMPVEARAFGVYRYFRFGASPTEKLVLPPDLAQQLKHAQYILDRLSGRVPPPQSPE